MCDKPYKHWLKSTFRKRDKSGLSRIGKVAGDPHKERLVTLVTDKGTVRGNGC
jgi:hypothetical protein